MKVKTSELIGPALDYSVAKCEAVTLAEHIDGNCSWLEHEVSGNWVTYSPSTDWSQGGPLIERERISIISQEPPFELWRATNGTRVCEEAYSFEINNEVTEEGPNAPDRSHALPSCFTPWRRS